MSAGSIQFLTDPEYEEIRRDVKIITAQLSQSISTRVVGGAVHVDINTDDIDGKLTAYVDQKIKRYY